MSTATDVAEGQSDGHLVRDVGRVHSLPTVSQPARSSSGAGTYEAHGEDTPIEINRPIWAVDLGSEMRALSTFDLWMALSRGDLSTDVLVWRMGRECWLPAREIPELACALSERLEAEERDAARSTLDYEDRSPRSGVFSRAVNAESPVHAVSVEEPAAISAATCEALAALEQFEQPDVIELDPADVVTDLPPPVAERAAVAHREPRRLVRARRVRRNLAASVLGAAVLAITTIAIAQPVGGPRGSAAQGHESPLASDPSAALRNALAAGATSPADETDETMIVGADLARPPVDVVDDAPRSISRVKRVSPEKLGQQRRRQK